MKKDLSNNYIKESLGFSELTPEEKSKRGILGRLYGPIADVVSPTRNGRKYSDKLWKKVFQNEIVKELLDNGGIPGELDHPSDREEILGKEIAIIMPEAPKEDENGRLIGYFDIIDTPSGRIAYQLAKYGFKLGISSRGTGDLFENEDGEEEVDPDTYEFTCFDLVIIPAVKSARLSMQENLNTKKSFSQALHECLDKASTEDRQIMEQALKDLKIDITTQESDDIINSSSEQNSSEAKDNGTNELLKSLQEALKDKISQEGTIKNLQETLAVSNTKVNKLEEELEKYKSTTIRLSTLAQKSKELSNEITSLKEELQKQKDLVESLKTKNTRLVESKSKSSKTSNGLREEVEKLNESLTTQKTNYEDRIKTLNENLISSRKEYSNLKEEYSRNLTKSNKLVESYKKLANELVDKYISIKAKNLGVTSNEVRSRLGDKYTISDVDKICEDLQTYTLNISKLPFNLNKEVRVRVTESKDPLTIQRKKELEDDDIDSQLIKMARLD